MYFKKLNTSIKYVSNLHEFFSSTGKTLACVEQKKNPMKIDKEIKKNKESNKNKK